jgi:NAD(P)-dependent dehydrogenase (short-subunit alcohol dehydrogenase family)
MTTDVLPQTVVLTGGTAGLGYACARAIAASHPARHLIIASRNQQQATRVVETLRRETGNQHIMWMPLDLASLDSIRSFARDFAGQELPPLRAVVCNAGLQVISGTTYTRDGFETTFGVNCLGHFLLVNLLLRHLIAPARIVFVSSDSHIPTKKKNLVSRIISATPPHYREAQALAWPEQYPDAAESNDSSQVVGMRRYSTSKLCDVLYAYELARRLQAEGYSTPEHPITVNAFNPGFTPGTGLSRDYGTFMRFGWNVLLPIMPGIKSKEAAGKELARLILDPALENSSGKYFDGMEERSSSQESYDQEKAAQLWEGSAELVKLLADETILSSKKGSVS